MESRLNIRQYSFSFTSSDPTLWGIDDAILLKSSPCWATSYSGDGRNPSEMERKRKHTLDLVSPCRDEVGVVAHASGVDICDGEHVEDDGPVIPDGVFFVGAFWRNRREFLDLGQDCFANSIATPDATD